MSKKTKDEILNSQTIETPLVEEKKENSLGKPVINVIIVEVLLYFLYSFLKGIGLIFFSDIVIVLLGIGFIALIALIIYSFYKRVKK